ncbi:MAG: RHS repeat-associated core domain-containing protein [Planctomycetota bacterium]
MTKWDLTPVLELRYDALGRRVQTIDHRETRTPCGTAVSPLITRHVYGMLDTVAEYIDCDGPTGSTWTLAREFVYGASFTEPVSLIDYTALGDNAEVGEPEVLHYLHDRLGSVVGLLDAGAPNAQPPVPPALVERYDYDPYGRTYVESWDAQGGGGGGAFVRRPGADSQYGNPFMWTGQRCDAAERLYHFLFRTYSPELGRWLQRDPIGHAGGINLYEYVASRPTAFIDPLGLDMLEPGHGPWLPPGGDEDGPGSPGACPGGDGGGGLPPPRPLDLGPFLEPPHDEDPPSLPEDDEEDSDIWELVDEYMRELIGEEPDTNPSDLPELDLTQRSGRWGYRLNCIIFGVARHLPNEPDAGLAGLLVDVTGGSGYVPYFDAGPEQDAVVYSVGGTAIFVCTAGIAVELLAPVGGTTLLYRSVTSSELSALQSGQGFQCLAGQGGKYFATSLESASSYAGQAGRAFGESYTIVTGTAPTSLVRSSWAGVVDGNVSSVFVDAGSLGGVRFGGAVDFILLPP